MFDTVVEAFKYEARTQCNRLKSHRNATVVRLHTLPLEIFEMILLWTCATQISHCNEWTRTLASVCKYWKTVVGACPRFWRAVETDRPDDVVTLALKKSLQIPLYLTVNSEDTIPYNDVWKSLDAETYRWASLWVYGDALPGQVTQSLLHTGPRLRDLKISLSSRASGSYLNVELPWEGRYLHHLYLRTVGTNWDSLVLSQLRSVLIVDLGALTPSLRQVIDFLSSSPLLEILAIQELRSTEPMSRDEPLSFTPCPIHLPHLRALVLIKAPKDLTITLPSLLRIPALKSIHICHDDPTAIPLFQQGTNLFEHAKRFVQSTDHLDVISHEGQHGTLTLNTMRRASDHSSLLRNGSYEPGMNIIIKLGSTPEAIQSSWYGDLDNFLHAVFPASLYFKVGNPESEWEPYAPWPFIFPTSILADLNITKLRIGFEMDGLRIIHYLNTPLPSGVWLCPNLDSVDILFAYTYADGPLAQILGNIVRARWGEVRHAESNDVPDGYLRFTYNPSVGPLLLRHSDANDDEN